MDNNNELKRRVALLETRNDQIEAELNYINKMLLECGFPEGVNSLKATIEELLAEASLEQPNDDLYEA